MASGYVFDAGALGGLEGKTERAKVLVRIIGDALSRGLPLVVPAAALAGTYRGPADARLSWLLRRAVAVPLDVAQAKRIGPIYSKANARIADKTRKVSITDVAVALVTRETGHTVLSTDRDDMTRLGVHEDRIWDV
jgi:hypothetical protein